MHPDRPRIVTSTVLGVLAILLVSVLAACAPAPAPAPGPATPPPAPGPDPATPPPASSSNCAADPGGCGFPDSTNTGVPSGTPLTSVPASATSGPGWHWDARGWLVIDGAGATVSGLSVYSGIVITAPNVTLKNSFVSASGGSSIGVQVRNGADNVTIQDTTITAPDAGANRVMAGVQCQYDVYTCTVLRVDIEHSSTGVQANGGVVRDSYIHDMGYLAGDHLNGITSNAVGGLVVQHNTILNSFDQTDAVSFFQDFGTQANNVVDGNLLAGGGYTIYGGQGSKGATSNIRITNNRISRVYFTNGGYWGWLAHFTPSDLGNVVSGNVWDDTGAPLN